MVRPIEEQEFWDKMRRGYWDKLNSREKFLAKLYIRTSACTETAFTPRNKEIASIFEGEQKRKTNYYMKFGKEIFLGTGLNVLAKIVNFTPMVCDSGTFET